MKTTIKNRTERKLNGIMMRLGLGCALTAWLLGNASTAMATNMHTHMYQEHYRWRNDDGTETTATWKQAANTPHTNQNRGENIRLRFCLYLKYTNGSNPDVPVYETGDYSFPFTNKLQYSMSPSGPWTDVPVGDSSSPFVMFAASGYTNSQRATYQLVSSVYPSGPSNMGVCVSSPSNIGTSRMENTNSVNVEFCFQATQHAFATSNYFFRVASGVATNMLVSHVPYYTRLAQISFSAYVEGAPQITSPLTMTGNHGSPVFYIMAVSGTSPITCSVTGLPSGLSFNPETRVISGICPPAGVYNIGLQAQNAYGTDNKTLVLTALTAADVILDPTPNDSSNPWNLSSASGAYGVNSWHAWFGYNVNGATMTNPESALNVPLYTWQPDIKVGTNYNVYAWWTHHATRSSNVTYRIVHAQGTTDVTVNQANPALAGQWNLLGQYRFNAGANTVQTLGGRDGTTCVDAMKWSVAGGGVAIASPGAGLAVNTSLGATPLTIVFDAGVSAAVDGGGLVYAWEFGDGAVGSGKTVSHTYAVAGRYRVVLTVTDGQGRSSVASATVVVQ